MNDLPRHTLARIIRQHGRAICDAPKRIEALLRDLCGAHRREINIIIGALEERVAADLLAAGSMAPREVLLARLAARLRDNLAYTPEAARWGVETWAFALGLISEAELLERGRAESAEQGRSDAPSSVRDADPTTTERGAPPSTHPPQEPTAVPRRQPPPASKASSPPAINAPPAASARRPSTTHPYAPVPTVPQPNIATPPARDASRRGLTLRGCLIGFVLLIVLTAAAVFVVPAVIMILKEEQAQPSINDPRIR
ncbi:MAG TPA: hypothetical protein VF527_02975 [Pyrinomonadaceae bacterium]|jgi:hypothetical protein